MTATMELSNLRPEEKIRQALIVKMTKELGFPSHLLVIEKQLHQLPHLVQVPKQKLASRRVDLLVFAPNIHPHFPLFPLLLIECKAVPLTSTFETQVIGYNDFVKAPFIALCNEHEIKTGRYDEEKGAFSFVNGFYSYDELMAQVSSKYK
jgi:hypothetical protein